MIPKKIDLSSLIEFARYTIPGIPTPLARPRLGKHGVWDSQSRLKLSSGIMLRSQHKLPLFDGPIHMDITFFMYTARPSKKNLGTYHPKRPDIDNLVKFVLDVANGILFKDDACVASLSAIKIYAEEPRTEIIIRKLGESENV